jgi:hypothetical protein
MISKTHKVRPPANGRTDNYVTLRSTPHYAEWLYALARATHRSCQEIMECSIARYSAAEGHPCGPPPERTTR